MEEKFAAAWQANREKAAALGIRIRPVVKDDALKQAHRFLNSSRYSDGFEELAQKGLLKLSLEALAIDRRFTDLFSDDEANNALEKLLDAGYRF